MGLSRDTQNKGEISTFQVLLDIAGSLSKLTNDPKALEKAAKESFALSDAEEAKAIAARADIAKNEAALVALNKKQDEIDDENDALGAKKASTQATFDAIRKEQGRLASVEADLGKRALDLNALKEDLVRREGLLEDGNRRLEINKNALDVRAQAIITDEKALKEKAAKLRGLMDA